jgi:hypothetical protein
MRHKLPIQGRGCTSSGQSCDVGESRHKNDRRCPFGICRGFPIHSFWGSEQWNSKSMPYVLTAAPGLKEEKKKSF